MDIQVSCEECGADMAYAPGTTGLTCQYCNHHMVFAQASAAFQAKNELNLADYLEHFDEQSHHHECHLVKCGGCGAETEFATHQQAGACPFCDTPIVVDQAKTQQRIKPQGLLPFKIPHKEAKAAFTLWVNRLWFAPNALKKQTTQPDKFKGVYLPYWTYDCDTHSNYVGQRGTHYYVTVTSKGSNGKAVTAQQRRTRWHNVSGDVAVNFDDILIPATQSLPNDKLNALEPWDLEALVDYQTQYLTGYAAESYQIDIKTGYNTAQKIMATAIRNNICRDIGGDEQRVITVNTHYSNATFKHILLPVWVSAYRFNQTLYQVMVNARTGEIHGQRPWSWVKIGAAVIVACALIAGAVLGYFSLKQTASQNLEPVQAQAQRQSNPP